MEAYSEMVKWHSKYYRIINTTTGETVSEGYAEDCAQQLDMPQGSFYAFVVRILDNRRTDYRVEIKMVGRDNGKQTRKSYVVRDRKTNKILAKGTAVDCADTLSTTVRSFYNLAYRARRGKGYYKVDILEISDSTDDLQNTQSI